MASLGHCEDSEKYDIQMGNAKKNILTTILRCTWSAEKRMQKYVYTNGIGMASSRGDWRPCQPGGASTYKLRQSKRGTDNPS